MTWTATWPRKTEAGQSTQYVYGARGELKQVTLPDARIIDYVNDPYGRRIAKKINGIVVEKYQWLGQTKLLAVFDGADALKWRFEYADGRMPVSAVNGIGTRYYLAYDQIGTLRLVLDAAGTTVKRLDYDTFGRLLSDSNPGLALPFAFAGGLFDKDTGLVRFGARDYDPDTGRWTAKDPIGFAGGDTDFYGYCLSDPMNFVDVTGLDSCGSGWTAYVIPEMFPDSCKKHDECYGTPGKCKDECDNEFLQNMLNEARSFSTYDYEYISWARNAYIFYWFVSRYGHGAYDRAQGR